MWFLLPAFSWWVQFSQSECWQFPQTCEKYLWHLKYKYRHAEFHILYSPDAFSRPVQFLLIRRLTCLPSSDRWYFYRSVLSVYSVQVLSWTDQMGLIHRWRIQPKRTISAPKSISLYFILTLTKDNASLFGIHVFFPMTWIEVTFRHHVPLQSSSVKQGKQGIWGC